jgi:hypothetical protein
MVYWQYVTAMTCATDSFAAFAHKEGHGKRAGNKARKFVTNIMPKYHTRVCKHVLGIHTHLTFESTLSAPDFCHGYDSFEVTFCILLHDRPAYLHDMVQHHNEPLFVQRMVEQVPCPKNLHMRVLHARVHRDRHFAATSEIQRTRSCFCR